MTDRILTHALSTAILGIDTLWGGDVLCASGTGRFIADCWFSDEPLPLAYTHGTAACVRRGGGVSSGTPDAAAIDAYLRVVDIPGALGAVRQEAGRCDAALRRRYLENLADAFQVMWDLALEILGRGPVVPFERCVRAVTGQAPVPSAPKPLLDHLARVLGVGASDLARAVEEWRAERPVDPASIPSLAAIRINELDRMTAFRVMPHLPPEMRSVPRANITFLPIRDAWFSGSMNYLGRARTAEGLPEYEATYEINASLQISIPEFEQLVSHEVVPGHMTTFALLQNLYARGAAGFEASVLTMNTRAATLFEGIANNAILIAHAATAIADLDEPDMQVGLLLARLQDEAKNQSAWLTWGEGRPEAEVAATLRRDYLVSDERASKLAGSWGRHPLLGRMCLPAYRAGTKVVARLRQEFPSEVVLPAIYGCRGLVDIVTVEELLHADRRS
jgi:hypothetical protein